MEDGVRSLPFKSWDKDSVHSIEKTCVRCIEKQLVLSIPFCIHPWLNFGTTVNGKFL